MPARAVTGAVDPKRILTNANARPGDRLILTKPLGTGIVGTAIGLAHAGFRPVIGEDDLPWAEIFRRCETAGGTEWYVVEYESDAYPPLEAVDRCLKAVRAMGK